MGLTGFEVEVQRETEDGGFVTEDMTLSMGPQHPSTHGVLRFVVRADGEVMKEAIPDIGYLHRSIEKIAEKVGWHGFIPYTDRVDYVAAMFCNHGWSMAAEKLGGIEVPKRAEYCRVIADELCRIHSHLLSVGTMAMDIGAFTPFTHAIREREYLNDLFEELCGARLTFHYMRIGGVGWDLPPGWTDKVIHFLDRFEPIDRRVRPSDLLQQDLHRAAGRRRRHHAGGGDRLQSRGAQPARLGGLLRRAARRPVLDLPRARVRRAGRARRGRHAGRLLRPLHRPHARDARELPDHSPVPRASCPDGPVIARVPRAFKPAAGDCYVRLESARGDMGWYVVSDGTAFPYRCKIRTGSFAAISMTQHVSRDLMLADLIAVIASFDLVAPEIDR